MTGRIAVIGGGPAGLAAAEALATRGFGVDIFDAMPSFGRKFLMAGKSGLNITHAEALESLLSRYQAPDERLARMVVRFGPDQIIAWAAGLRIDTFTGSTGRVFPAMMKASPLLRAWLLRLQEAGVRLYRRCCWTGWNESGALVFQTPDGPMEIRPAAAVLALGGGSWRRLGSDGAWVELLAARGVEIVPFRPANCGFLVDWSERMRAAHEGAPVKSVRLTVRAGVKRMESRGEFIVTRRGVEGGGVYQLSAFLVETVAKSGAAVLDIDLVPDLSREEVETRLRRPRGKASISNHLRKALGLSGVKLALLFECTPKDVLQDVARLAAAIKALPLPLNSPAPLDEAISTAGGVAWSALDDKLMLQSLPGVFCAGEMIDWDAPTGGYLLTACLATGRAAGKGAADWATR